MIGREAIKSCKQRRDKIPIDTRHPEYNAAHPLIEKCEDAYEGEPKVKEAGTKYLPKLSGQKDHEYADYKFRALFADYTKRTVQGLTGAALFKEFEFNLPSGLEYLLQSATRDQMSLSNVVKILVTKAQVSGRFGLLVDRAKGENDTAPYLVIYDACQIINWREEAGQLNSVVLEESYYEQDPLDAYKAEAKTRWRELLLEEGKYIQRIWIKVKDKVVLQDEIIPTKRGVALDFIPFTIVNSYGIGTKIECPPILPIASVNLSHYQNSADLENVRHVSGAPTLLLSGVRLADNEKVTVGSSSAIVSETPASGMYIEVSPNGPGTLERALEQKAALMAMLGSRFLEGQRAGIEAAETVRLRQMGDSYTLASLNLSVADGLSLALSYLDMWQGGAGEVTVTPNKDFSDIRLQPQEIASLMQLYQAGGMSLPTLLFNLHRAEMHPPDISIEDEMSLIDAGQSNVSGLPELTPEEKSAVSKPDTQELSPDDILKAVTDAIESIPAPVINVAAPVVNIPAPVVNVTMPDQQAQQVQPIVLNTGTNGKVIQFTKDKQGKISGATINEG